MVPDDIKKSIDHMTYEQMLKRWRHSKLGDSIFQGESGDYYSKSMAQKEVALAPGEKVKISKKIGW